MRRSRASRTTCSTSRPTSASPRKGPGGARLTVTDAQVAWLESEIDRLNAELEPLKSFILPGGSAAAAYLHLARTVCRRAERIMVELKDAPGEGVSAPSLKYVNRLSDYLFVAGRYANDKGRATCCGRLGRTASEISGAVMVIPLWDDSPLRLSKLPLVTWGLMLANVAVFSA